MDLKGFLKPTKGKIISFILFLTIIYAFFMFIDNSSGCTVDEDGSFCYSSPGLISKFLFWPVNLPILLFSKMGTASGFMSIYIRLLIFILGIVGNLLYLYLISTLVLKLIEKFKK